MKTHINKQLIAAFTGAIAAASVSAAPILIDLSENAPVSNPAGDGKFWNSLGSGPVDASIADLLDSGNASTGISLSIDVSNVNAGGVSGAGFGGAGINGTAGADPFDEPNAITDGIFANNNNDGTAVLTFGNLSALTAYDLSAIGGRASGGKDGIIDILTGTSSSPSYDLLNDGTVLDFTVTSDAAGVISIEFKKGDNTNGTAGNSTFNALSITEVPEPSSLALLAAGGLLIARRRRS